MYHVGRVMELFSGEDKGIVAFDNSTQALLDMWDENLITVGIDPHLSKAIKQQDVVLVDYTQTPTGPRMIVVKVLRGDLAKRTWKQYKDHLIKMRAGASAGAKGLGGLKGMNVDKQSYVG